MSNSLQSIKEAFEAGRDKRKNGANVKNCSFRHFATKEQTKAWEQGANGEKLSIEIIKVT